METVYPLGATVSPVVKFQIVLVADPGIVVSRRILKGRGVDDHIISGVAFKGYGRINGRRIGADRYTALRLRRWSPPGTVIGGSPDRDIPGSLGDIFTEIDDQILVSPDTGRVIHRVGGSPRRSDSIHQDSGSTCHIIQIQIRIQAVHRIPNGPASEGNAGPNGNPVRIGVPGGNRITEG